MNSINFFLAFLLLTHATPFAGDALIPQVFTQIFCITICEKKQMARLESFPHRAAPPKENETWKVLEKWRFYEKNTSGPQRTNYGCRPCC